MALVNVDEQGKLIPTAPPPNPTAANTPYFNERRAYPSGIILPDGRVNPNLIQMLGGIGAQMDPQGAAGILGRAAIGYSQQEAAQRAYAEQQRGNTSTNRKLFDILGGWGDMSPKGKVGPTSAQANPDGSVTIKGNLTDEITQTNMPMPDTTTNRQMAPMEPDIAAGKVITNDNARAANMRSTKAPLKLAPLPPPMPREQLEQIPVTPTPRRRSQTMLDLRDVLPF